MTPIDWLPAVTSSGLLAAALWFGRNLIQTRLTKSVQHEFDAKLEKLRAQLRDSEERLKSELRARESEIAALRSGAMTAMASRQMAVDSRRLQAVDQLWSSVTALAQAKTASLFLAVLNFDAAAERAERDPKFRQLFETLGGAIDVKSLDLTGAAKARPFVSPIVWASYSALLAMIFHSQMRLHVLKSGLPAKDLVDDEAIREVIRAALPQHAEFIDKFGAAAYPFLIEQLELKLLQDLQAMLAGSEADKASIEQAAEILRRSNEVLKAGSPGQHTA